MAIVRLLGALPVVTDCSDADALQRAISPSTAAVVVSHVEEVVDVKQVKAVVGRVPIVEDCARAFSARVAAPAVETGDYLVFSFGPGKQIDVGEAGMVVSRNDALHRALISLGAHPIRQTVEGLEPSLVPLSFRPHPVAAIMLAVELQKYEDECTCDGISTRESVRPGVVYDIPALLQQE